MFSFSKVILLEKAGVFRQTKDAVTQVVISPEHVSHKTVLQYFWEFSYTNWVCVEIYSSKLINHLQDGGSNKKVPLCLKFKTFLQSVDITLGSGIGFIIDCIRINKLETTNKILYRYRYLKFFVLKHLLMFLTLKLSGFFKDFKVFSSVHNIILIYCHHKNTI